ncbi:Outer membrane protein [Parvularcula bermudensis HTCC2503]|uniref:Outer membrane protein n=1 Tax=Parvularcula bermudensis (strain ATCC BAA-594 / HTCC2503 / KCTC 12087) TaxID=314260 RepID=E0THH9_PARBH|nr:TonB-dependent receptor [Parvularcula bermudensis]ADM10771.1 Outer membrane protein [Parvularcula bermudensis HTCC2503]
MKRLLGAASGLALLGAASAAAQSQGDGDVIVVQGQKIEQSLDQVTSSVDVTTSEEILREPIVNLYDVVDRIPNVTSSFGGLGFAIRGIDQRGIAGNGATLTVYVDDSPLGNFTTFFGPLDSWDLGQVEVYRGPQSTNFGRNALAGAIYVRTQDPTYDWDVRVRAEAGNNGVAQGAVAVGGPIIEDKLAFRAAANYRESDGFIFNTFLNEEADAAELKTGRFKLLFEPTDRISIISTSSYTENFAGEDNVDPTNGVPGQPLDAGDVIREVDYDTPGLEGTETFIQSINATWRLSDRIELQSITTYQDTDYTRQEDFDNTSAPIAALDRTGVDEAWSEEFRAKYLGDRFEGVLGFYYFTNEDGFNDSFIVPATIVDPSLPATILVSRVSANSNETTNYAGFFDGEYEMTPSIDLLFGLRYDKEEQDSVATAITSIANPPLPAGFEFLEALLGEETSEVDASYEAWLPKGGVRWEAHPNATLSFVVQRAYRAGGAQILTLNGSIDRFEPEFLWNYELAARTNFLDGRIQWNTNVFYADWRDQQVNEPVPDFPTFFTTINAGESTLYGFETDMAVEVTPDLLVYGGLGYSHTEFDDFPNANYDPDLPDSESNQENFSGNRFPFAPRWSLNAGMDYRHPSGLFGGVDVNHQSKMYQDNENFDVNEFGERMLVNARLGYQFSENMQLSAYVKNALDEQYFTSLNVISPGDEFSRLGAERTYAVRLDFDF